MRIPSLLTTLACATLLKACAVSPNVREKFAATERGKIEQSFRDLSGVYGAQGFALELRADGIFYTLDYICMIRHEPAYGEWRPDERGLTLRYFKDQPDGLRLEACDRFFSKGKMCLISRVSKAEVDHSQILLRRIR
jgi:hypothetical protein